MPLSTRITFSESSQQNGHAHLAELRPQLAAVECVQVVERPLVVHGPHQRVAVAVREQRLDAVTNLHGDRQGGRPQGMRR